MKKLKTKTKKTPKIFLLQKWVVYLYKESKYCYWKEARIVVPRKTTNGNVTCKLTKNQQRKMYFFRLFALTLQHKSKAQNWEEARILVPRKQYQ